MKKNYKLELIRGLAAIAVLFTHLRNVVPYINSRHHGLLINLVSAWGGEAVIVFFILSGIVIFLSYEKKKYHLWPFLKNRLLRLVPGAWIGVGMGLIAAPLISYHPSAAIIAGNMLFMGTIQGFITHILITNGPLWSLSFEMAFYIFFIFMVIKWKNVSAWLTISILCFPVYLFLGKPIDRFSGIAAHLVATMTYSFFFLLGIFIYKYRNRFRVPLSIGLLFFTLFMMPARFQFADPAFDLLKHLGMALVLTPLFLHCISNPDEQQEGPVYRIGMLHFWISYAVLAALFWLSNKSLFSNALLYSLTPLGCFVLFFFRRPGLTLIERAEGPISYISKTLGKLSYGIYIFHYPLILILAAFMPQSMILLYVVTIVCVFLLAWILEYKLQPVINKFFNR
jgi:peptidoglycan/LPS O-acetylase OafA/YrhL